MQVRLLAVSGLIAAQALAQFATDATDYIPPFLPETNSDFRGSLITTASSLAGTAVFVTETPETSEIVTEAPEPAPITTAEPITTEEPEPITTEAPEPITTEEPEPITTEAPQPITTETPEPITTETPQPITTETPQPITTEAPQPITTEGPQPIITETPQPITTEGPQPITTETPVSITTTPEPSQIGTPSVPDGGFLSSGPQTSPYGSFSTSASSPSTQLSLPSPSLVSSSASSSSIPDQESESTTPTNTAVSTTNKPATTSNSQDTDSPSSTVILSPSAVYVTEIVQGSTTLVPISTYSSQYLTTPSTVSCETVETSYPIVQTQESVIYSTFSSPTATLDGGQQTVTEFVTETSVYTTTFSTAITTSIPVAVTSYSTETGSTKIVLPVVTTSFVTLTTSSGRPSVGLATTAVTTTRLYTTSLTAAVTSNSVPNSAQASPTVTPTSTSFTTYVVTEADATYILTRETDIETTYQTVTPATITSEYLTTLVNVPLSTSTIKPSVWYSNRTETDTIVIYEAVSLVALQTTVITTDVTVFATSTIQSEVLETITATGQFVTHIVPVAPETVALNKRCDACEDGPHTIIHTIIEEEICSGSIYTTTSLSYEPTEIITSQVQTSFSTITTDYVVVHASEYTTYTAVTTEVETTSIGTTVSSYPSTRVLSGTSSQVLYNVDITPVSTSSILVTSYVSATEQGACKTITGSPYTASEAIEYSESTLPAYTTVYVVSSVPAYSTSYSSTKTEVPSSTIHTSEALSSESTSTSSFASSTPGAVVILPNEAMGGKITQAAVSWKKSLFSFSIVLAISMFA